MRERFEWLRVAWSHRIVRVLTTIVGGAFWYTGVSGRYLLWHTGPHVIAHVHAGVVGRWGLGIVGVLILGLAWGSSALSALAAVFGKRRRPQVPLIPDPHVALALAASGMHPAADEAATNLRIEGEGIEHRYWGHVRDSRRAQRLPKPPLPPEIYQEIETWNANVIALADARLSVKEAAAVASYDKLLVEVTRGVGGPDPKVLGDLIDNNLAVLRRIEARS